MVENNISMEHIVKSNMAWRRTFYGDWDRVEDIEIAMMMIDSENKLSGERNFNFPSTLQNTFMNIGDTNLT